MTKIQLCFATLSLGMIGCQLGTETTASSSSERPNLSSSSTLVLSSSALYSSSALPSSSSEIIASSSSISSSSLYSSSLASSSSSVKTSADFSISCPSPSGTATANGKFTQHCTAYNHTNTDLSMIVYRKNLQLTPKWTSSFCFGLQCYADFIDSSDVSTLKAHDSLPIPVYTNVNGTGSAKQTMVLERVSDHLNVEASLAVTF